VRYTTIYNNPHDRAIYTFPWVYWDDAFTEDELKKVVEYGDEHGVERGTTLGIADEGVRVSNIKFHERNNENAWIFDKLNFVIQSANEMFYGFELNGYDAFQYTTYNSEETGRYNWHMDMATGKDNIPKDMVETRKLSLTLCLNDEFEGGEFQINDGNQDRPQTLPAKKGRAFLFPSFMIHRVMPVTKGVRKSIVVWVTGPKFV